LTRWLGLDSPLLTAGLMAVVYCLWFERLFRRILVKTGGAFVFPLDDVYVGMALAKNFALHGSWSPYGSTFQSVTSTPAFSLLLAGLYRITGPTVWGPLLLSFGFALVAILLACRMLCRVRPSARLAALLGIVILTPLPVLGILGMEHTLHVALVFAFLQSAGDAIANRARPPWSLLLVSAVMVMTRYEGLFMVAFAGLFFLLQRQVRATIVLWLAGTAPVLLYGLLSVLHGCYWLPHSISLKGYSARAGLSSVPTELGRHFLTCFYRAPHLGALLGAMAMLLILRPVREDRQARAILGIVLGAIVLQLLLADVGSSYRYEAYLVAASIAAIACAIGLVEPSRHKWVALGFSAFLALGSWKLMGRAYDADLSMPFRSAAVYFQQIQMARFLTLFEPGVAVAANDVGAINYFANIRCTDLAGLADKDIFWLRRRQVYSADALARVVSARHVKIAILYDSWFIDRHSHKPMLPRSWIRVQTWITPYGDYFGSSNVVSFYAVDPSEAEHLKRSLERFDASLPSVRL
jgi:hypothetical protein